MAIFDKDTEKLFSDIESDIRKNNKELMVYMENNLPPDVLQNHLDNMFNMMNDNIGDLLTTKIKLIGERSRNEEIRGKTLNDWKSYCADDNVPIKTMKYITVLEEKLDKYLIKTT
jgi:hypothetical protein